VHVTPAHSMKSRVTLGTCDNVHSIPGVHSPALPAANTTAAEPTGERDCVRLGVGAGEGSQDRHVIRVEYCVRSSTVMIAWNIKYDTKIRGNQTGLGAEGGSLRLQLSPLSSQRH
jgi:hypothetical protein